MGAVALTAQENDMKRLAIILLMMCAPAWAANDFTLDPNCLHVYNCESGALTTDSKGSLTLIPSNISADTTNYKQGSAALTPTFAINSAMYTGDGLLGADFPGKNGTTNRTLSVTYWIRHTTIAAGQHAVTKWDDPSALSWSCYMSDVAGTDRFRFLLGYNGGSSGEGYTDTSTAVGVNKWYHVGMTYDGATKGWMIRIWDDDASSVGETTGTGAQVMNCGGAGFYICNYQDLFNGILGQIDEVTIFNDVLTADQIDMIRLGTYSGTGEGSSGINDWWWRRRHNN